MNSQSERGMSSEPSHIVPGAEAARATFPIALGVSAPERLTRAQRRERSLDRLRARAAHAAFAGEVFHQFIDDGRNNGTVNASDTLVDPQRRVAAHAGGLMDAYMVAKGYTTKQGDETEQKRHDVLHAQLAEHGVAIAEFLTKRLTDSNLSGTGEHSLMDKLNEREQVIFEEAQTLSRKEAKKIIRYARKARRQLPPEQKEVFDKEVELPDVEAVRMTKQVGYSLVMGAGAFVVGDGMAVGGGGGSLALYKDHDISPNTWVTVGTAALTYIGWLGAMTRNVKANRRLLKETNVSTSPVSKAARNLAQKWGLSERWQDLFSDGGYYAQEVVAKDALWWAGALGVAGFAELVSPEDASSTREAFREIIHGESMGPIAEGAVVGMAGAYAGGALYEAGSAVGTNLYVNHLEEKAKNPSRIRFAIKA